MQPSFKLGGLSNNVGVQYQLTAFAAGYVKFQASSSGPTLLCATATDRCAAKALKSRQLNVCRNSNAFELGYVTRERCGAHWFRTRKTCVYVFFSLMNVRVFSEVLDYQRSFNVTVQCEHLFVLFLIAIGCFSLHPSVMPVS